MLFCIKKNLERNCNCNKCYLFPAANLYSFIMHYIHYYYNVQINNENTKWPTNLTIGHANERKTLNKIQK